MITNLMIKIKQIKPIMKKAETRLNACQVSRKIIKRARVSQLTVRFTPKAFSRLLKFALEICKSKNYLKISSRNLMWRSKLALKLASNLKMHDL